jgi:hypothetical protein
MRILNFILATMFLLFALVQINDPDPVIWILIYGIMSVLCVLAAFNFYPRIVIIILGIVYLGYSVYYFPGLRAWFGTEDKSELFDNVAKMEHAYIEESREFLGLMICVAVLLFHYLRARHLDKKAGA